MSTSGVLGRQITVDSTITTVARALLAAAILFVYCKWSGINLAFNSKEDRNRTVVASLLLGAHWITYFYALDLSNVAIALLSLYTYAAMTSILEPMILKIPFVKKDVMMSLIALVGVAIMLPEIDITHSHTQAIILGLISALLYALRNILIRKPAATHDGSALMFHQLWIIGLCLSPFFFIISGDGLADQFGWVFLLALITTAIGHTLFVKSLKQLSASTAGLLSCIVPVYGILWAYFLLDEIPNVKTIIGGLLIITVVALKAMDNTRVNLINK